MFRLGVSRISLRGIKFASPARNCRAALASVSASTEPSPAPASPPSGGIGRRFIITAEVTISKLFPAGFGWQAGSIVAGDMGFKAADAGFAVVTGLGDMTGVFLGHSIYYGLKSIVSKEISIGQEVQTAFFLGSAAFCSGAVWQPVVNFLQLTNAPFEQIAGATWLCCGLSFFGGLRFFRMIYRYFVDFL